MAAQTSPLDDDMVYVPRALLRLPLVLSVPSGFVPADPATWPRSPGRFEYVEGRLEYMPPCGVRQQGIAIDVGAELVIWSRTHPDFFVGGNQAGMMLGDDVRGADAVVHLLANVTPSDPGFPRVAPILAVEVVGKDDTIDLLRDKAKWYLAHGVAIVWLVDPTARSVFVITKDGETEARDHIPESPLLPGLAPSVADFFRQV